MISQFTVSVWAWFLFSFSEFCDFNICWFGQTSKLRFVRTLTILSSFTFINWILRDAEMNLIRSVEKKSVKILSWKIEIPSALFNISIHGAMCMAAYDIISFRIKVIIAFT